MSNHSCTSFKNPYIHLSHFLLSKRNTTNTSLLDITLRHELWSWILVTMETFRRDCSRTDTPSTNLRTFRKNLRDNIIANHSKPKYLRLVWQLWLPKNHWNSWNSNSLLQISLPSFFLIKKIRNTKLGLSNRHMWTISRFHGIHVTTSNIANSRLWETK